MKIIIASVVCSFFAFFLLANPVLGQPHHLVGKQFTMKAANLSYVQIDNTQQVKAGAKLSDAQHFTMEDAGAGHVYITAGQNQYFAIDAASRVWANANQNNAAKFEAEDSNGKLVLKAPSGNYVFAAYSSGGVLMANGATSTPTTWVTTITSVLPIGSTIVLQGDNTRYISLLSDGKLAVNQDKTNAEKFIVVDAGNGMIALQAVSTSKYVTRDASPYQRVSATAGSVGDKEKYVVEELPSGGFSLKVLNGSSDASYVLAAYSSGAVLLANSAAPKKFMYQYP